MSQALVVLCSAICWASCEPGDGDVDGLECLTDTDCDTGQICDPAEHNCEACVPDCSGRICGPDPTCGQSCGDCDSTMLANGGFELPLKTGDRPPYWYLGMRGNPQAGVWSLDANEAAEGAQSLKLEPAGDQLVSQILHLPAALLAGRSVTLTLEVKHDGTSVPPAFMVVGFNPEVTHPQHGPGIVGQYVDEADSDQGMWKEYSGSFNAIAGANQVVVLLVARGNSGSVWFDNVRVVADPWAPAAGPDPATIDTPLSDRTFDMGFVCTMPMDKSDLGFQDLVDVTAATGDVLSLFFDIRWCRHPRNPVPCTADPIHATMLHLAQQARQRGLSLALTLNFTHTGDVDEVGQLNPLPDGSSPGALSDPVVQDAYEEEILWLFDQLLAEYVLVGIEVNLMYMEHPEWWDAYVAMEGRIYDAIKTCAPDTHVSTYFTLPWMVTESGELQQMNADIWRMLLPKIDSVAYSFYPNTDFPPGPPAYPAGYFSKPHEIAPELPVMIPEFGMAGGGSSAFTETDQAQVLRQVLVEVASADPVALIWFGLYDQAFFGMDSWFQESFSHIGMHRLDGTPKESFVLWQKVERPPGQRSAPRRPLRRVRLGADHRRGLPPLPARRRTGVGREPCGHDPLR